MHNLSEDEDPQLTKFLQQHRSSGSPDSTDLEDRVMSAIDRLAVRKQQRAMLLWMRRIFSGFGIVATGFFGATIHYLMNPPEPTISELDKLDRYMVAHARSFVAEPGSIDSSDDLDAFLLQDDDTENI